MLRIHVPVPTLAVSSARLRPTINSASSIVCIAIIASMLGGGFAHFDHANLGPSFPFGAAGVFCAAIVVYWSYTGFDMVATMAEETKNPGRDVPLGLIASISTITVCCAMSLTLVGIHVIYLDSQSIVSCMLQNSKQRSFVCLITIFSCAHEPIK